MKTRNIIALAAVGCFTLAQAQGGITAPATDGAAQPQGAGRKSAYHDCLMNAGKETFDVLRLEEGQIVRVTELQTRYKADLKAADDEKASKGKQAKRTTAVKEPAAKDSEQPVTTLPPAGTTATVDKTGTAVEDPMEELRAAGQTDPLVTNTEAIDHAEAMAPGSMLQSPALGTPSDPAAGDELQTILTSAQWSVWHKQCYNVPVETGMIQP